MSENGPLYDTAHRILDIVAETFDADARALPDRVYVVPGITAAYDCEQLTVTILTVVIGVPGSAIGVPIANCGPLRYATYRVELIREVPTVDAQGNPPTATALDDAAAELLADLHALHGALVTHRSDIAATDPEDPMSGVGIPVAISSATPVGSDGGVAGSRVDIDVPF